MVEGTSRLTALTTQILGPWPWKKLKSEGSMKGAVTTVTIITMNAKKYEVVLKSTLSHELHEWCRKKIEWRALHFIETHDAEVLDLPNEEGETPLWVALKLGLTDVAWALLNKIDSPESIVTKKNSYGYTALHYACYYHFTNRIARRLLDLGADVNAKTNVTLETPLHFASYSAMTAHLPLLIERGADVEARSSSGETAADMADAMYR